MRFLRLTNAAFSSVALVEDFLPISKAALSSVAFAEDFLSSRQSEDHRRRLWRQANWQKHPARCHANWQKHPARRHANWQEYPARRPSKTQNYGSATVTTALL